ncbi:MAG TPA: enterotoxin [Rhodanobacteraceae bacterium]
MHNRIRVIAARCVACAAFGLAGSAWGAAPATTYSVANGHSRFGNATVAATWQIDHGALNDLIVTDELHHAPINVTTPFALTFKDGTTLTTSDFKLQGALHETALPADANAARLVEHYPGQAVAGRFVAPRKHIAIDWKLVQREGSDYLREIVTVTALDRDAPITKVALFGVQAPDVLVDGSVDGSPVISHDDWIAFEQPMSKAEAWSGKVRLWMNRTLPLRHGQSVTYSAVIGVAHAGQMRRDFATYIQRERAHPYRPFLLYNSWFDIGYFNQYTQAEALNRIDAIGRELATDRHVKIDSFVFDDGWDDHGGAWHFSKDFPDGFVPVCKAAEQYGAQPGVWLSPWGGYGKPHAERVAGARKLGYGIVDGSIALSAPKYWQRFHHVVMKLLNDDCINEFKFDGTGNVNFAYPGSQFDSDFAAAIQLIHDIRADKPDTFINLTTGTWASPFWLKYADSIWRDGFDTNYTGVGSKREQWITYRDEQTYRNIVEKGPLFPLNSLMVHGVVYAERAPAGLNAGSGAGFANGVRALFASGTDLEELHITPSLLSTHDWDVLADAAHWARANASVLEDTHWIGGDPGRLDVYGWAAWSPAKAFITLRNPDDRPRLAILDVGRQLQLPKDAVRTFAVSDVWHTGGAAVPATLAADQPTTILLQPFEVLTLQLLPTNAAK